MAFTPRESEASGLVRRIEEAYDEERDRPWRELEIALAKAEDRCEATPPLPDHVASKALFRRVKPLRVLLERTIAFLQVEERLSHRALLEALRGLAEASRERIRELEADRRACEREVRALHERIERLEGVRRSGLAETSEPGGPAAGSS